MAPRERCSRADPLALMPPRAAYEVLDICTAARRKLRFEFRVARSEHAKAARAFVTGRIRRISFKSPDDRDSGQPTAEPCRKRLAQLSLPSACSNAIFPSVPQRNGGNRRGAAPAMLSTSSTRCRRSPARRGTPGDFLAIRISSERIVGSVGSVAPLALPGLRAARVHRFAGGALNY